MDSQLFAVMAGGGQSDAILRANNNDGSDVATNFQRLFQDHPDFTHLQDIAFDLDDGYFFLADSDGVTTRILRGNIADLASGTGFPTLTEVHSGPADQFINGIEIDTANNRLYFTEGDILSGHSLKRVDYDGSNAVDYGPIALAFDPIFGFAGGVYDFVLDPAHDTAYFTYTLVDAFFSDPPTAPINYIVKLNSLADPNAGYTIVPIVGGDDPDGPGGNPDNHFPESMGSLRGIDIDADAQVLYFVTGRLGPDGTAGIFKLDLATGVVTEIWEQPANSAHDTPQPFPTTLLEDIEVDTIGGVYYVTTFSSSDVAAEHDGTATDEAGSRIFVGNLSDVGVAPTDFVNAFEPTSNGAPLGMEINYAATISVAGSGVAYTEQGAATDVIATPSVSDPDQTTIKGATVAITAGFTAGDTLAFTPSGGVSGSYNAATGVLTLTGSAGFADYQAVLDSITFSAAGDNPDDYGANPTRTISFSLFDGLMDSDAATTVVTINAVNDAPVNTTGGPVALLETDPPAAITGLSVSDVDADPANDAIEVTLSVTLGTLNVTAGPGVAVSGNGTSVVILTGTQNALNATFATANSVTYSPGASGVDTLTMTTSDLGQTGAGGAQQDTDLVVITVINVNDAPTAPANNSVSTAEDNTSAATAIGAADPDGDSLTYSEKPGFGAANGTVTFDQMNGTFTYTPDLDFNGSDSFTILIDDGNGGTAEQVVSVTVTPVNDAPTASATNSVSTAEDSASAPTAIGANDVDGDTLVYSEKPGFGPGNGSVTFNQAAGTFTYTPTPDFNGTDSFTILIDDGNGGTAEQVVSVTVTPVNDAPTAPGANSISTAEDTASAATAIDAEDIDGDSLTYSEKPGFGAANGTVSFNNANGTFVYTPDLDFHGTDSFTILIDDGNGGTAEQVVSVTVTPVNDAPTGVAGTLSAPEDAVNGSAAGTLVAQDPDSASFTYELLDDAGGRFDMDSNGNVIVADGLLLDYEQASSHTLTVRVTDDQGASSEFEVEVTVSDVLGEDVTGDARDNIFVGGAENDILRGMDGNDVLVGGGGQDTLLGGNGIDWINGGAGADTMTGDAGHDTFVFHKGEANGDVITDFFGRGNADGDFIVLHGYGAGTTFTRVGPGNSNLYKIDDNGFIEYVTIYASGQVHTGDWDVVTSYDYNFFG